MTGHNYEHVLGFALEHPWALTHSMRSVVAGILARRVAGEETDPATLAALVTRKNLPQVTAGGDVALIPIYGVIAPRMNMLSEMSGGTTFESLTAQLHAALDNPKVKTIVFDVDSPGGNVAGASEFAREVLKARVAKPIIAQAQYLMASAAYWPMACCTEIVASPSASVGSVGVYTIHDDISDALAALGVKRTVIGAGKFKTEGVGGGPLSEEALTHIKAIVAEHYDRFVSDISKGRGISEAVIRNGYGEGRCVTADAALACRMVDRIGTLSDTLARVLPSQSRQGSLATDQEPLLAATSQEREADALWHNARAAELLCLDL